MKITRKIITCISIFSFIVFTQVSCQRKTVYHDAEGDGTEEIYLNIDSNLTCRVRFNEIHSKKNSPEGLALEYDFIETGDVYVEQFEVELRKADGSRFIDPLYFQSHNLETKQTTRRPDFQSVQDAWGDEDYILNLVLFKVNLKEYGKFHTRFKVIYSFDDVTKEFMEVKQIVRKRITVPIEL
ncbi:hypothetical protein [Pollutibacter soli]|uniref:hypothetical protein n=1 Tax=Pollutibacter soli TaxID=3034157 RepID=UPI003013F394